MKNQNLAPYELFLHKKMKKKILKNELAPLKANLCDGLSSPTIGKKFFSMIKMKNPQVGKKIKNTVFPAKLLSTRGKKLKKVILR